MPTFSRGVLSAALATIALGACGRGGVGHVGPAKLSVQPSAVDFGLTWVGHPQDAQVVVSNDGSADAVVAVAVGAPFSAGLSQLDVPAASRATLSVRYAPTVSGHDAAHLTLGGLTVSLSGDARIEGDCPPVPCNDVFFDTLSRSCASTPQADGTACHTGCTAGTCQSGNCLGTEISCDDGNSCTVDGCSEPNGCTHAAQSCAAPTNPCRVGACDPLMGCVETPVADGVSCGEDLCASSTVQLCLSGACVRRPRMAGTRCENAWVRPYMDGHESATGTWDSTRRRAIQYGGWSFRFAKETWEWDWTRGWQQTFPANSPDFDYGTMGYDPSRQRAVLFGAPNQYDPETWEWDGVNWTRKFPAHTPPPIGGAFVFDSAMQQLVLYTVENCVAQCFYPTDFWAWDGNDWTDIAPQGLTPFNQNVIAVGYDDFRQRLVVLAGTVGFTQVNELWEYDGTQWAAISPDGGVWPDGRMASSLVYDPGRAQLLLYGDSAAAPDGGEVWAWNGTSWTEQTFTDGPRTDFWSSPVAFDAPSESLLVFSTPPADGGRITDWAWDGGQWSPVTPAHPMAKDRVALAYDATHDEVVMFGGFSGDDYQFFDATWLWNGTRWTQAPSDHSPPARSEAAMAFDSARGVVVLFGGINNAVNYLGYDDTWEWDGSSWTLRTPAASPSARYGAAMAYDPADQKMMLFGGYSEEIVQSLADLWEYDGTTWSEVTFSSGPKPRCGARMVYDEAHQQLVLVGGTQDRFPSSSEVLQDTWTFDGTAWTDRTPTSLPAPRQRFGMAYDRNRQRVWAFGGWTLQGTNYGAELNDTLEWDGATWQTVSTAASPPAIGGFEMIYDPTRDELLLFGGAQDEEHSPTDATWVYGPP